MSDTETGPAGDGLSEDIPLMQQLLDSPILLLVIGIVSPMLLYVVWGVMEVIAIPLAQ